MDCTASRKSYSQSRENEKHRVHNVLSLFIVFIIKHLFFKAKSSSIAKCSRDDVWSSMKLFNKFEIVKFLALSYCLIIAV